MAGTIIYDHSPNDTVWLIIPDDGIKHGLVLSVESDVISHDGSPAELVTVWYNILIDNGPTVTVKDYVYAQNDKASALAQYDILLDEIYG